MKRIDRDILVSVMVSFSFSFILFMILAYFRLETLFLDLSTTKSISKEIILKSYNSAWIELFTLFLALFLFVFYLTLRLSRRMYAEIENLNEYLNAISKKKDYSAVLQVEHYLEFLTTSLHLKNIIKRLYSRDKKKK
jgi:hypothetical protein